MGIQLEFRGVSVEVLHKDIKHLHLSVHPPTGRGRISAPEHMSGDTIRVFAISKLGWIQRHQQTMRKQERETPRDYLEKESHYVWGRRYLLAIEAAVKTTVEIRQNRLVLRIPANAGTQRRQAVLADWHRQQMHTSAPGLIAKWENLLGVKAELFFVQHMRTKWAAAITRSNHPTEYRIG